MREQLKLLEKLQQVDAKLQETDDALTALPAKLKSLKEDVARVESLLEGERQQLAGTRHYREEIEAAIRADQEQLTKSKTKMAAVRTSKEYMAGQREMEASRKSSQDREEELAKLMEAIDKFQQSIKVHEEELTALKQHVGEEEQETANRVTELEGKRAEQRVARQTVAGTVAKDVLAKYEAIRRRRGHAVVAARHGVCTGCNMHLPPQLYNILHRANTIEYCPSCHRIIFIEAEQPKE